MKEGTKKEVYQSEIIVNEIQVPVKKGQVLGSIVFKLAVRRSRRPILSRQPTWGSRHVDLVQADLRSDTISPSSPCKI
ncbi:hypothetical protein C7459_105271 [Tumebacillus permanentifrigoris]|uniref:Uncharacterized protein n=1 Tax=Tumebacillus permanentifrigoris TaxID=378543 RepID=A0A316DXD8_9BACL|nr:hypothetical protein C7459_105271 [Tumebacillus permanentifrigoris]